MKLRSQRIDRHAWLATWLQQRRRKRIASVPTLSTGLVAHWGFDGTDGNHVDDVNGFVLAPTGGIPQSVDGIIGKAVRFPYNGSYLVSTQRSKAFCPTIEGFTVSFWVNITTLAVPNDVYMPCVWDDADPASCSWDIYSSGRDQVRTTMLNSGGGVMELAGPLNFRNGWVHICLIYCPDSNSWTIYGNAVPLYTDVFGFASVNGILSIGVHLNMDYDLPQGTFDELAIWSRTLSPTEIAKLYNNGAALAFPYT